MLQVSHSEYLDICDYLMAKASKVSSKIKVYSVPNTPYPLVPAEVELGDGSSCRVVFLFSKSPSGNILAEILEKDTSTGSIAPVVTLKGNSLLDLNIQDISDLNNSAMFSTKVRVALLTRFSPALMSLNNTNPAVVANAFSKAYSNALSKAVSKGREYSESKEGNSKMASKVKCSGCGDDVDPGKCKSCTKIFLNLDSPKRMLSSRVKKEYEQLKTNPPEVGEDLIASRIKSIEESGKLSL